MTSTMSGAPRLAKQGARQAPHCQANASLLHESEVVIP